MHPIVLAEFYYAVRKAGYEREFTSYTQFVEQNPVYRWEGITWQDLKRLPSFSEIPEMHDRLVAICANRLQIPILTRDAALHASPQVTCVW